MESFLVAPANRILNPKRQSLWQMKILQKSLRKWLLIQPEKQMLELAIAMYEKNNWAIKGHPTPTVFNAVNHLNI
ncbi:MAG: hypothetical protein ACLSFW_07640 [Bacteroides cellulosilyticus]